LLSSASAASTVCRCLGLMWGHTRTGRLPHPFRGTRRLDPPSLRRSPPELLQRDVRLAAEPGLPRDSLHGAPRPRCRDLRRRLL